MHFGNKNERLIVGIILRDREISTWIPIADLSEGYDPDHKEGHRCADHVSCLKDNR